MPENCDAACQKLLLDAGMAKIEALLYSRVVKRIDGLRPVDYESPQMFFDAAVLFEESATRLLNHAPPLSAEQKSRLMAQLLEQCYRADDFIAWSQDAISDIVLSSIDRTVEIVEWVKDDQNFFTALTQEVG